MASPSPGNRAPPHVLSTSTVQSQGSEESHTEDQAIRQEGIMSSGTRVTHADKYAYATDDYYPARARHDKIQFGVRAILKRDLKFEPVASVRQRRHLRPSRSSSPSRRA